MKTISSVDNINFRFEFGVYVPLFNDLILAEYKSKPKLKIENCLLVDYGNTNNFYNNTGYYKATSGNTKLEQNIISHLETIILPYFQEFNDTKKLVKALTNSHGYIENIIAALLLLKTSK